MAAPIFNDLNNTPTFTENSSAVLLDNNASVTDADVGASTPYTGATLTLARSTGANADDLFSGAPLTDGQVTVLGSIEDPENPGNFIAVEISIGTYTSTDGTLVITFNDQATGDRVTDVLRQLTYANSSETPPASVVIGYSFNDGETATGSITVTINQVNDPPSIDALDGSALYQPGSAGVVLSPNAVLSDPDSPTLSGAAVSFSGGFLGTDVLSANVGSTGITANYAGGVLTLSGPATVAQYRQVLASVTYSTTAADPTNGDSVPDRTLNWFVKDSANANSPTISTTLSFGPSVDLDASGAGIGFATTFTQGGAAVAIADSDADITATFQAVSGVTVVLTNARAGDALSATGGPLDVTVDNSQPGRITLLISGSGSITAYENALKSVTFSSSSGNIDPTTRDVTVTVSDFIGNPSLAAHSTITINGAVNDPGSAADDTATTAANTALFVAGPGVLANDNDPDGLVVVTGAVATSGGGAIQFQPDGSYAYTPAANFSGTDTVVYTAQDPFGSQVSATLRITVNATNAASRGQDFNADSTGDILWGQKSSGFVAEWLMNNGQIGQNAGVATLDTDFQDTPPGRPQWHFQDTGDFNADGRSDILWRHDNGQVALWTMNGGQITNNQSVATIGNDWRNEGAGDFNGDGKADVLWHNNNGQVALWTMDGAQITSNQTVATVGGNWHFQGLLDANEDGRSDVLLRDNSGQVVLWTMNGAQIANNQSVANLGLDWNIQGTGDFNGDGRDDVLLRNDSGQVVIWQMNGAQIASNLSVAIPGNDWHVQDVGDYNHDGRSDVLWRNDSGQVAMWEMNGATITSNHTVTAAGGAPAPIGLDWTVLSHHYDVL